MCPPSSPQAEKQNTPATDAKQPSDRFAQIWRWLVGLSWKKKLYVALIAFLVLWLLPNVLSLGLVGVERTMVGALVAVEKLMVAAVRALGVYGFFAGMVALMVYGVNAFFFDKETR